MSVPVAHLAASSTSAQPDVAVVGGVAALLLVTIGGIAAASQNSDEEQASDARCCSRARARSCAVNADECRLSRRALPLFLSRHTRARTHTHTHTRKHTHSYNLQDCWHASNRICRSRRGTHRICGHTRSHGKHSDQGVAQD